MLARGERIRKDAEITFLFRRGRKRDAALFRFWLYDKKKAPFRGLVTCSRKVDKRATVRNLLKRRVREILRRDVRQKLPTYDVMIDMKPEAKNAPFKALKQEILNALLNF